MIRTMLLTDLRLRMRNWSSYVGIVVVVALTGAFALGAFALVTMQVRSLTVASGFSNNTPAPAQPALSALVASQRGVSLFIGMLMVVMVASCLTAGIQAATAIVGEKERQTYDLLWTTRLRPTTFLLSKFASGLAFGLLLLVATLPVFSLIMVYDGVRWQNAAAGGVVVFACLAASAAVGLSFSAIASSTLSASLLTGLTLLLGLFSALAVYVASLFTGLGSGTQTLLYFSPPAALFSTVIGEYRSPMALLFPAVVRASPAHPVHVVGNVQNPLPLWVVTATLLALLVFVLLSTTNTIMTISGRDGRVGKHFDWLQQRALRLSGKR